MLPIRNVDTFAAEDAFVDHTARVLVPFLGRQVSCGLFGIGDDFIEKYQSLDARFIKNKESTFFFKAVGSSMAPTIFPGEVLIVDRSVEATNGRVCVLAYEDELICKRIYRYSSFAILKSDNPKHKNIRVDNPDSVLVWGVVIARAAEVR